MKSQVQDRFHDFYHTWFCKLEEILHHLLQLSTLRTQMLPLKEHDVNVQHLVNTATTHIKQYYTVKWAEAREDVLPFFAPTWLTPLENASSWITGWKPSMVFRLVRSLATASFGMSEEQARKIEELRMRMRMEEEKVEREMERLQVAMADHKMVELAKLSSRAEGSGPGVAAGREGEVAVKGVLDGLERTMKGADCVRLKTLKGVLDLLTPLQCVEFLAAVLALQLRLRQWGKKETGMPHVPRLNERRPVTN
ncbi:protein DOG1-like 4 [Neltuma alba]|uniref:protein DOG1-like 4 n=1 Tax=Neltuma alba TaxID=207710 RepID=UPI0010A31E54|nr:protein DOG1-like 4 [Prosopis alba]